MGLRSHAPEGCNDCQEYEKKMTEKRTFINMVDVDTNSRGYSVTQWSDDRRSEYSNDHFSYEEWTVEVTFTKKPVKPEVGGTCRLSRYGQSVYTIIAIDNDLAWVRDQGESHEENTGWIEPISKMLDVRPWTPA